MSKLLKTIFFSMILGASLNAQLEVNFASTNLAPNAGDDVLIDVSVSNWNQIVTAQFFVEWDSTVMTYDSILNVTTDLPEFTFLDQPGAASSVTTPTTHFSMQDGFVSVSWSQSSAQPFTIPDGTRLFTIRLKAIGAPCAGSGLTMVDPAPFSDFLHIEIIDENFNEIGAISNSLDFQIPGPGCSGTPDDVGIIGTQMDGAMGDTVCWPVTVENFTDIQTVQGSMQWDTSLLKFDRIANINPVFIGLVQGSFNPNLVFTEGKTAFAWFDNSGVNPVSVPDGTVFFEICFVVVGDVGECAEITFVDDPVKWEIADSNGAPLSFNLETGKINVTEANIDPPEGPLEINITPNSAGEGERVCMDFTVQNFDSIGSIQYNMVWDESVLEFDAVENLNQAMGLVEFNFNDLPPNKLRLTWNDPSSSTVGVSLPDGDIIYSACFNVVADCDSNPNATTEIMFVSDAINIEITNGLGEEVPYQLGTASFDLVDCGDGPTITDVNVINPTCPGDGDGSVLVTVTGMNTSCTWRTKPTNQVINTGGSCNLVGQGAGEYCLTVVDAAGGSSAITVMIVDPLGVSLTGTATGANCVTGGSISITCTGGEPPLNCVWTGPTSIPNNVKDATNLDPGSYTVVCTDQNGCSTSASYQVGTDGGGESVTGTAVNGTCTTNGSISITPSGFNANPGVTWTGGLAGLNPMNVAPGTYTVVVTDAITGCTADATFVIERTNENPPVVSGVVSNAGCTGGGIDLDISNISSNYSVVWDQAGVSGENPTGLAAGTYDVTVTDNQSGCSAEATFMLTDDLDPLVINITIDQNVLCFGEDNGMASVDVAGGCNPTCSVEQLSTGATFGCSDLSSLPAGDYTVTVVDAMLGSLTETFTIGGPTMALAVAQDSVVEPCPVDPAILGAIYVTTTGGTPGYNYVWNGPGGPYFTEDIEDLTDPGLYVLSVLDDNMCSVNAFEVTLGLAMDCDTTTMTDPEVIIGGFDQTSDYTGAAVSCFGSCDGSGILEISSGTAPFMVTYNGSTETISSNNIELTGLCADQDITVSVSDVNNMTASTTVNLQGPAQISINLEADIDCEDESNEGEISIMTAVDGGVGGYVFAWSSGGNSATEENLSEGNYILSVTDANNCLVERLFEVELCDPEPPVECHKGLNIITPNNDGANDIFEITCADENDNVLGVYDRYGVQVYDAINYQSDWDGLRENGEYLDEGPYYWVMQVTFDSGETRTFKGSFTVLR